MATTLRWAWRSRTTWAGAEGREVRGEGREVRGEGREVRGEGRRRDQRKRRG
jgi:hypothetical protein